MRKQQEVNRIDTAVYKKHKRERTAEQEKIFFLHKKKRENYGTSKIGTFYF